MALDALILFLGLPTMIYRFVVLLC